MQYEEEGQPIQIPQNLRAVGNVDPNFNMWFLDNKESIENLANLWRGYVRNTNGQWVKPNDNVTRKIMNETGIHWATQFMESFLDKVFQSTNWDEELMNYVMRENVSRPVWHTMQSKYREFELNKVDAYVVGKQIIARVLAIVSASRGEGIRKYLMSAQQISEIRQSNPENERKGFFTGIGGLFNKGGANYG